MKIRNGGNFVKGEFRVMRFSLGEPHDPNKFFTPRMRSPCSKFAARDAAFVHGLARETLRGFAGPMNAEDATAAPTPAEAPAALSVAMDPPLPPLEARVLGCLIEKESTTPDVYPLTLNSLVNACNQKNNRDPVMSVGAREVEIALENLRARHLVTLFAGADARVQKYKHRLEAVFPMEPAARAMMGEFLLRGPQTAAGVRANAARMVAMPELAEVDAILDVLATRPAGPLVVHLPRLPGQKEARWAQLLTGAPSLAEPSAPRAPAEPLKVAIALPPETEARIAALEAQMAELRTEFARMRGTPDPVDTP
jgi:uncharacterized protein YceH (UPF0502 family)